MTHEEQRQIAAAFDALSSVGAVSPARDYAAVGEARKLLLPLLSAPAIGESRTDLDRIIKALEEARDAHYRNSVEAYERLHAATFTALCGLLAIRDEQQRRGDAVERGLAILPAEAEAV